MNISNLFKRGKAAIKESVERFPIAILLSTALTLLMIYVTDTEKFQWDYPYMRIAGVLALGIPLFLCIHLVLERRNKEKDNTRFIYYGVGAALLLLYGIFLYREINMVTVTRHIGLILALTLIFLFIPYIKRSQDFELYIIKVLGGLFTTGLYAIVLQFGISAILFTVDYLLEIKVEFKMYSYVWFIIGGIFAPCFFLGGIPRKEEDISTSRYPKGLKVLMVYIVMPLLAIYAAILYIYFGKIIVTWTWPEGLVSHLVLWYGVISAGTLFLVSYLAEGNQWVRKYLKIFPKAILPLMIMMFVSMGIRVNAYGITENRYFVLALGLWVFGIMVYLSLAKNRRNIILPISLAAIILVSVCGPLSSYSLSKYSQNKRLEEILGRNNMLENGVAVKAPEDISVIDQDEISSIVHYFNDKHTLKEVKCLPENFSIEDLGTKLGVKDSGGGYYNNYKYFNFSLNSSPEAIDIKEYDYLFELSSYGDTGKRYGEGIAVDIRLDTDEFKIYEAGEEIYSKSFDDYAIELIDAFGIENREILAREDMTFEDENGKVKVKIIFRNIYGEMTSGSEEITSTQYEFYVLVKMK